MGPWSGTIWNSYGNTLLPLVWNHMELIWKSIWKLYFHVLSSLVLEAYGTHMEGIWNPYGNPYGNHKSMSYVTNFVLEPYGSHMEVIWKSQTKKKVTRLVLEAYGTHMEIHMEIINPCLMLLTSIWNHMEVIWKSYGSPKQKKMLL